MVAVRKLELVEVEAPAPPRRDPSQPVATVEDALRTDEIDRARNMALLMAVLAVFAMAWSPFLGGDPVLKLGADVASAYFAIVCTFVWTRARPDASYRPLFRWFGVSAAAVSAPILLFYGVFSPTPIVIILGISFFGTADDRRWGLGACIGAAAQYAVLASLVAVGIVADTGLIRASAEAKPFCVMMVTIVFLGTMRQALVTRRATCDAMARVETAVRTAKQREAQLAEANLVLELPVGKRGAYSGRRAGSWQLGAMIGRGATGEVYAATHAVARTQAAVKVLISSSKNKLQRFQRELDIATRMRASGLVEVYEAGVLEGDLPFLVMELLKGHDLGWHLRRTGQLDLPEAIELCDQVAAALGHAHGAGIVHRDIKPQNLFLDGASWKILDFGMSRLRESRGTLTQNAIIGTPGYMAPEQARAHAADERSDLFSLGAVMYRAVTGQTPFRGRDTPQILFDLVYKAPRRPTDLARSLPSDLDLFFAIALAKRPADRFKSTAQLAAAFRDAAGNQLPPVTREIAQVLIGELPWRG